MLSAQYVVDKKIEWKIERDFITFFDAKISYVFQY